jgi:hypothetical protein
VLVLIVRGKKDMEVEPIKKRGMEDDELNEAVDAHSVEELDGLSMQNQRLARVQEYEEAAVSRPDPLAAVSGMGAAFCQRIFEHLGTAVLDELDRFPHSVEEFREYEPEIRLLAKLRKSIEQDLTLQAHETPQQGPMPHRKKGNVLPTKTVTSKRDLTATRWPPSA